MTGASKPNFFGLIAIALPFKVSMGIYVSRHTEMPVGDQKGRRPSSNGSRESLMM